MVTAMPDLHDERRQEPRFRTAGSATMHLDRRELRALVLDISLNGLKLARPEGFDLAHGSRFKLTLRIAQGRPFVAEVKLVHIEPGLIGLEFYDMPPADFAVLIALIDAFQTQRRSA
jgi:hypothetical protein